MLDFCIRKDFFVFNQDFCKINNMKKLLIGIVLS